MRGQGPIEYVFMLGVALVFVLIVIGLLSSLQDHSSGISKSESDAYWAGADLGVSSLVVSASGARLSLTNNHPFAVEITEISFIGNSGRQGKIVSAVKLKPGETADVDVMDVSCTQGQPYSYSLQFAFSEPSAGTKFVFTGKYPIMGTCE